VIPVPADRVLGEGDQDVPARLPLAGVTRDDRHIGGEVQRLGNRLQRPSDMIAP
jgi:hypothetical protein